MRDIVELIEKYIENCEDYLSEGGLGSGRTEGLPGVYRVAAMMGNQIMYVKNWGNRMRPKPDEWEDIVNTPLTNNKAEAKTFGQLKPAQDCVRKLNAITKRRGKAKLYVEKDGRLF